ncbi:MAG: Zn-dependent alcohol dehydrogenase [Pseudomonadota bacterium]
MRAAVCHEFGGQLVIEEVAIADPGPTQVKVAIRAVAICHSDIHFSDGAWGGALPAVYGHEASGTVIETGAQVTDLAVGDRVAVTLVNSCGTCRCCTKGFHADCERPDYDGSPLSYPDGSFLHAAMKTGAFAEQVVVHHSQVCKVGDDISFEVAALLACGGITGFGAAVNTADMRAGDDVAVIGCGGVGLNAIQGASIAGAGRLIAVDLADDRLEAAKAFGATHGVNGGKDPVAQVREITAGRGVDHVLVTVGVAPVIEQGLEMLANGGAVIIVGMPKMGDLASFEPLLLADASHRIVGSHMGHCKIQDDIPWLCALYRNGRIKMDELITARFPFERINDAIAATRRGEGIRNVVMVGEG